MIWRTLMEVIALAAVGYGLWLIYPPLTFIVIGLFVLCASLIGSVRHAKSTGDNQNNAG